MAVTSPLAAPAWEYAPAPESTGIVSIAPSYGLFIGGEFAEPASGGRRTYGWTMQSFGCIAAPAPLGIAAVCFPTAPPRNRLYASEAI